MIDFVKIIIKDLPKSILEANKLLDFYDNINIATGEIKTINKAGNKISPFKKAEYKSLEFKIYESGLITLSGSLHKYWNEGKHNFNDFNLEAVLLVLQDLNTKFDIHPNKCILKCLEVGINIEPPIPTNEILDNCFMHKTKPFEYKYNNDEGKFKQVQHSRYIIKLYNKGLQYKPKGFEISNEIMRFEIKYIKMQHLNEKGIFTIQDLINYGLKNFKIDLINEWENVLFFENPIRLYPLVKKTDIKAVLNYKNPCFWTMLISNNQIKNYTYHKRRLKDMTTKYSEMNQSKVSEKISEKIEILNPIRLYPLLNMSKRIVFPIKTQEENTPKKDKVNSSICRVTGLSLKGQKTGSHFLSHTGLKLLYENDKMKFDFVLQKHLPKQYKNSDLETKIIQTAKSIRTKDCIAHIKQNKILQSNQSQMMFG